MNFPNHLVGTEELAKALADALPKNRQGHQCPPEQGSCEWWQGQRGHIAGLLIESVECAAKTVETETDKYDYAKAAKCYRELLAYIDDCDKGKPFCGVIEGGTHYVCC